jgi:hypothetical protein
MEVVKVRKRTGKRAAEPAVYGKEVEIEIELLK